jgi:hypothetical protein
VTLVLGASTPGKTDMQEMDLGWRVDYLSLPSENPIAGVLFLV